MSYVNKKAMDSKKIENRIIKESRDSRTIGMKTKVIVVDRPPVEVEKKFELDLSDFPSIGKKKYKKKLHPLLAEKTAVDIVKAAAANVLTLAENVKNLRIDTNSSITIRDGKPNISVTIKALPIEPLVRSPSGYERLQKSKLVKIFENEEPDISLDIWLKANYEDLSQIFRHFRGIISWMEFVELAYRTTDKVDSNDVPIITEDDYEKIDRTLKKYPGYYDYIYYIEVNPGDEGYDYEQAEAEAEAEENSYYEEQY